MAPIVGFDRLAPKRSAVDERGQLRTQLIDGVIFRPTRPVPHEDGTVSEVARMAWPELDLPMCKSTSRQHTPVGSERGDCISHLRTVLFVVRGLVSIVVYDGRIGSSTQGMWNEFRLSDRNPGLVVIPPNLYHGSKNIGIDEAFIINMPSSQYAHEEPDALDLPYDALDAAEVVPFRW